MDTTVPSAEEGDSLQLQQQTCPLPPPAKKGKSAAGTPCAQPPKEDAHTFARKIPASQGLDALADTYIDPDDYGGEATPAPSCS